MNQKFKPIRYEKITLFGRRSFAIDHIPFCPNRGHRGFGQRRFRYHTDYFPHHPRGHFPHRIPVQCWTLLW